LAIRSFIISAIVLASTCSFAEAPKIESRIANGEWETNNAIDVLRGESVSLRVKPRNGSSIQWFEIIPDISIRYNNAVWPWLPDAYKWKGFDEIKYDRNHLKQFEGKWQIDLPFDEDINNKEIISLKSDSVFSYLKRRILPLSSARSSFRNRRLGSFWYQAEIIYESHSVATSGIDSKDKRGLSPNVFRVSIKQGDDLIGKLTSYFNVPAVFGSTPYQVRNYIGIDCADVLMAAYCKSKNLPINKDFNVAMLTAKFKTILKARIKNGRPTSVIHWEKDVRAGDFIAVKYSGGKQYQHIGALYCDQNKNGFLDEKDLVLHAGPDPLHWSELRAGKFDGTVLIIRPI